MASVVTRINPEREIESCTDTAEMLPEDSFITALSNVEIQGMILAAIQTIQERNQRETSVLMSRSFKERELNAYIRTWSRQLKWE